MERGLKMEIFEAIDNRKTIRKYDDYKPTTEEVKRIINSARLAPSAINMQNWKFIAVFNQNVKEELANSVLASYDRILSNLDDETKASVERYKGHSTFFKNAPFIIVCVEKFAPSFMGGVLEKAGIPNDEIKLMRPDSYLLSMGGAIENMLLSAYALGLGSCWMVAPVLGESGMRKTLNLKEDEKIVSILAFGRPAKDATDKRSPKKGLDEIMEIIE